MRDAHACCRLRCPREPLAHYRGIGWLCELHRDAHLVDRFGPEAIGVDSRDGNVRLRRDVADGSLWGAGDAKPTKRQPLRPVPPITTPAVEPITIPAPEPIQRPEPPPLTERDDP